MAKMKINVQAHHNYIPTVDALVQQLKDGGMDIQDEIKPIGNFTGLADSDKIENLKKIPGVASVDIIGDESSTQPDNYKID